MIENLGEDYRCTQCSRVFIYAAEAAIHACTIPEKQEYKTEPMLPPRMGKRCYQCYNEPVRIVHDRPLCGECK